MPIMLVAFPLFLSCRYLQVFCGELLLLLHLYFLFGSRFILRLWNRKDLACSTIGINLDLIVLLAKDLGEITGKWESEEFQSMAALCSCEYILYTLLVKMRLATGLDWVRPHKKFTGEPFETFLFSIFLSFVFFFFFNPADNRTQ